MIRPALLCLIAAALSMPPASAAGRELNLGAKDIPPKIREAAEAAVPGIVLDAVKLERTADGIIYEVKGAADGQRYEIEVDKEGKVLEVEEDDSIALSDVPEAVRKAAEKAFPGAKLVEAEMMPGKAGEVDYILEMRKDGKDFDVRVSPKGEVAKVEESTRDAKDAPDKD